MPAPLIYAALTQTDAEAAAGTATVVGTRSDYSAAHDLARRACAAGDGSIVRAGLIPAVAHYNTYGELTRATVLAGSTPQWTIERLPEPSPEPSPGQDDAQTQGD